MVLRFPWLGLISEMKGISLFDKIRENNPLHLLVWRSQCQCSVQSAKVQSVSHSCQCSTAPKEDITSHSRQVPWSCPPRTGNPAGTLARTHRSRRPRALRRSSAGTRLTSLPASLHPDNAAARTPRCIGRSLAARCCLILWSWDSLR